MAPVLLNYFILAKLLFADLTRRSKRILVGLLALSLPSRILVSMIFLLSNTPSLSNALTVSGPVAANSVISAGDVTISSMTVSSMTVTQLFRVPGNISSLPGRVLQVVVSSTTSSYTVASTTWTAVPDLAASFTLSDANNYVRVSLSGNFGITGGGGLTIFRGGQNLGDPTWGLIEGGGGNTGHQYQSAGIVIADRPGDTATHVYQVYLNTPSSFQGISFPLADTVAYFLLEEVSQ